MQVGAAIGATIFPLVGPGGVVALRQAFAAIALLAVARPRLRDLTWRSVRPALLLGLVLVTMNLAVYGAIDRIGLGLAVTLEFLGPLALALAGSRRRLDLLCAAMAGLGVVLLTGTVPGIDPVGVLLALVAAASWAAYIVLSRRAGRTLPGVQGTALASLLAAVLTSPLLVMALVGLAPEQLLHVVRRRPRHRHPLVGDPLLDRPARAASDVAAALQRAAERAAGRRRPGGPRRPGAGARDLAGRRAGAHLAGQRHRGEPSDAVGNGVGTVVVAGAVASADRRHLTTRLTV